MADKLKVCMLGLGLTGKEVAKAILAQEDMELCAVVCSKNSVKRGQDLGEVFGGTPLNIPIYCADELEACVVNHGINAAIDFSCPAATLENVRILKAHGVHVVIGTTGFDEFQLKSIKMMAERSSTGIVYAPNITTGINVLMMLTNLAASILGDYDPTIIESHFKKKKDAPSGTAKKIAKEIVKGSQFSNEEPVSDVPILAVRAGGIVGRHEVILAGEYDRIEIVHESFSRKVFALGALRALRFIVHETGYYEMQDVLNFEPVFSRYLQRSKRTRTSVARLDKAESGVSGANI